MPVRFPQYLQILFSLLLLVIFIYLGAVSLSEIDKKTRDDRRIADMQVIQKAIDQYHSEKQIFPFAEEQNGENYLLLMQDYLRKAVIPYDPNPQWEGKATNHPACYQFADGTCFGRFVFDLSGNSWYMQIKLERKTLANGACKFPVPTDRYCIGSQRVGTPY